jgi:hypothetical protein
VTRPDYDSIAAVNWSTLKAMRDSPAAYRWLLEHPRADTPSLALGRAVHSAILTPFLFDEEVVACEMRRDLRTAAYRDFLADNEGKTILTVDEYAECRAMAEAVRSNPLAIPYLREGRAEVVLQWTDAETGIPCKGIADWLTVLPSGLAVLLDLKSARTIDARAFGSAAAKYGYHSQLAFYSDGLAALGTPVGKVAILAVEKQPPYECGVFVLTEDHALYAGREEYRILLRRVSECRTADRWPGRYEIERALELPAWMFADQTDADDLGVTFEED